MIRSSPLLHKHLGWRKECFSGMPGLQNKLIDQNKDVQSQAGGSEATAPTGLSIGKFYLLWTTATILDLHLG